MAFSLITAPTSALVPLHDLKRHLRIRHNDEDATIANLEAAAVRWVEAQTGHSLMQQTWRLTLDGFPAGSGVLELARGPVSAVTEIAYKDSSDAEATLTSTQYILDTTPLRPRIVPAVDTYWPNFTAQPGCVRVTYTAGYADRFAVPSEAKQAVQLLVSHWFEHREGQPFNIEAVIAPLCNPFLA